MNQQMMQFGNQPAGFGQPGNYSGSFSPPGGGPPPPNPNSQIGNYPPPRQFTHGMPQPNHPKNLLTTTQPPAPGAFIGHVEHGLQPAGQLTIPSTTPSGLHLSQGLGPTNSPAMPAADLKSAVPTSQLIHSQNLGTITDSTSGPIIPQNMGPIRPPIQAGFTASSTLSNGQPVSQSLGSQSQQNLTGPNASPSSQFSVSQPQNILSGPTGSATITTPQSRNSGPPLETLITNGSTLAPQQNMLQSPGQLDANRQFVNGALQGLQPGGPPPPQRHPINYALGVMASTPNPPARSMYPPPTNNLNHQPSSNLPFQQLTGPYSHSPQIKTPYSPGNYKPENYSGSSLPPQNEMHYPPVNQGPYQPINQQYSGLNQNYPGVSSPSYPQPQAQPKPQRKLDPEMLPNPIQVMQDNEKNRSGVFYTDQKGLMPPLVTTNFITQDRGNCSPRFLRSTTYSVPFSSDLLKQTSVPFALLISPLARIAEGEHPLPIVNMGELGPVRCNRCKAYMSPFMQFVDGGRRFHCVFCKATSEVPAAYFQHLDHTGQRVDRYERPELLLGAYEYIATKDYCRDNQSTEPPAFIFVIDVSYNNVKSGLVSLLCSKMKEIITNLPRDEGLEMSNMKVGFITYSSSVHFYNIKSCLAAPQMLLVGDVNEMFMPLLDGFLCDPTESEVVIDLLMQEIPRQFGDTRDTETILYPAIRAGLEALKASNCAGKLLVFHSSLPIAEAPGKLKNRDDRKVLNTDKEKTVLAPQNNSYSSLGEECVKVGCSVDLFIFNNSYVDLATIGEVSRLTGGEIFKYTYFQSDVDGDRFIADLKRDVSRKTAFDATMRVRTSTGVRPTDFYGNFFMSNTKDIELASIDSDKAVAVEIKHDDKLTEEDGVYIQVALLYTSCGGQRRLRILNLSLNICTQMADLYRTCDLDTLINYFSKQGIFKLLESSSKQVKTDIMNRCANILACYRKNCANPSSIGQLILPECMKLLPLYVNTLLKSDAFSGGSDMTCDDRSFAMHCVLVMDLTVSVVYFYPRLVALHNIDPDSQEFPIAIRCTYEKLQDDGVYLLDNGIHMFMWLGLNAPTSFISNVFGVPTSPQVDTDKATLPALDNPLSFRIRKLIDDVRQKRHRSMRLTVLKERDKMEMVFKQYLMEDHSSDGSPSYSDFICHMHSQIRTILS